MNIRLREVEPGDLPLFFAHQQDAEAAALAAFPSRDRAAFDQHWAKLLANQSNLARTIVVSSAALAGSAPVEHVVGNIGSFTRDGMREVGYWIDRAYWGRGVATGALRFPPPGTDAAAIRRRRQTQRAFPPRPGKMRLHARRRRRYALPLRTDGRGFNSETIKPERTRRWFHARRQSHPFLVFWLPNSKPLSCFPDSSDLSFDADASSSHEFCSRVLAHHVRSASLSGFLALKFRASSSWFPGFRIDPSSPRFPINVASSSRVPDSRRRRFLLS